MIHVSAQLLHRLGARGQSPHLPTVEEDKAAFHTCRQGHRSHNPFGNVAIAYGDAKAIAEVGEVEPQCLKGLLSRVFLRVTDASNMSS